MDDLLQELCYTELTVPPDSMHFTDEDISLCRGIRQRGKAYTLLKVRFWERGNQEWENILEPMASVGKQVLI